MIRLYPPGNRLFRLPICGGNWNNTSNACVFNVNLNNPQGLTPTATSGFPLRFTLICQNRSVQGLPAVQRDLKESISAPTVWKEKNGSTRAWVEPSLWRHTKQETPMEAASNESRKLPHIVKYKGAITQHED